MITSVEPFILKNLVPYQSKYLSGFSAERYALSLKNGWEDARANIKKTLRNEITRKINADVVRNMSLHTSYSDIKYKHTLLPVWISSYRYRNKVFNYMVNGQTGRFSGKAPKSILKIIFTTMIAIAIILLAVYHLGQSGLSEEIHTFY